MGSATIRRALAVCRRPIALAVGLRFACCKVAMRRSGALAYRSNAKPFVWSTRIRHSPLVLLAALATGPACAGDVIFVGDYEYTTPIESLRYNTNFVPGELVELAPAIVTATMLTSSNTKLTLFLEDGTGSDQWSAIEAYGDAVGQPPAVGDCVRVKGTFVDFGGAAEISPMIWWPDTHLEDCGYFGGVVVPPTPIPVSIDYVATDTSPGMAGNQPGLGAESHESALVTLQNVTVLATSTHSFEVYDGVDSGTYLLVDDFLYHYAATVGTHFSSITGVLNEYDGVSSTPVYQLLPRSASDIVVGP